MRDTRAPLGGCGGRPRSSRPRLVYREDLDRRRLEQQRLHPSGDRRHLRPPAQRIDVRLRLEDGDVSIPTRPRIPEELDEPAPGFGHVQAADLVFDALDLRTRRRRDVDLQNADEHRYSPTSGLVSVPTPS